MNDTISAISTPKGEGGIGIVRLSGPSSLEIVKKIFRPKNPSAKLTSHTIHYGHIVDPNTNDVIDEVLVTVMLAPRTYTREDVVEINCHGGIIPLSKTLELTLQMGARLAEPGEFTKRAFLNGRIDLSQAEAVIDIIRAKTDMSLKVAMKQLEGRLSKKIKQVRDLIFDLLVEIEASIDFPEEDIEFVTSETMIKSIDDAIRSLEELLSTADEGRIISEGLKGVIVGRPNVGKSSLFNALLNEDRAIVTSIPGTTRDAIEEYINIEGIPLKLTDTAGIRKSEDIIEIESIERTKVHLDQADMIILVLDASEPLTNDDEDVISIVRDKPTIVVLNKVDLPQMLDVQKVYELIPNKPIIRMSVKDEIGLNELKSAIKELVFKGKVVSAETVLITKVRHKKSVKDAIESLQYAKESVEINAPLELIAVDIRGALSSLGEIIGETPSEEILEQIFSRFCIGK